MKSIEELLDVATGVLGDAIDWEVEGWSGHPWLMFVVPGENGDELSAQMLGWEDELLPAQLEMAFRERLPTSCAVVELARESLQERAPKRTRYAVLSGYLDSTTSGHVLREVSRDDDGRERLWPLDGPERHEQPGSLDRLMREGLRLSRGVRAGTEKNPSPDWMKLHRAGFTPPPAERDDG